MRTYSVEHTLGALLELRDYQRLDKRVGFLVQSRGWSHIVWALRTCRESEAIVPGWDTHLREGILREGMIELLGLHDFVGLDVDFLEEFADLEADSLSILRKQSRVQAIELLREQVRKNNTFHLDVEPMKLDDLVVLVPHILEARIKEVQDLGRSPDLYEVYSTYYGFQFLTTGVNIKSAGVPVDIREDLLDILGDLGGIEVLQAKQVKFSSLAFRNCSPHLTVLLWNMLRLANGGMKAKSKALEVLGELGDSRAIDLIHSYVEWYKSGARRSKEYRLVEECLLCLGRIGNPHSFEIIRNIPTEIGNMALGGIRHPIVRQVFVNKTERSLGHSRLLTERSFGLYEHRMARLIQALSNTRSREWLVFYEMIKQKYRSGVVRDAIEQAAKNVHPPFDFD